MGSSDEMLARVGRSIRLRRTKLGMSQEQLATKSGLHRTYITDVERGARNLSLRSLARVADGLGIASFALLKDAEELNGSAIGTAEPIAAAASQEVVGQA